MKIFNWVHWRFNQGSQRDGAAKDVTRTELVTCEADKQALGFVDVLEGWKDGILTIGTLGFDPILEFSTKQKGYFILGSEADQKKLDCGVKVPEFSAECQNSDSYTDVVDDHRIVVSDDASDDDEGEANPLIFSSSGPKKPALVPEELGHGISASNVYPEVETKPNCVPDICEGRKGRGGRVTLAELFQAESGTGKKKDYAGGANQPAGKKPAALGSKNGLSFVKKLIPHNNQEKAQPIKNLNRFMRKMLKKKIHPDVDGKYCKMGNDTRNELEKVEAAHLDMETHTQDSMFLLPTTPQGF